MVQQHTGSADDVVAACHYQRQIQLQWLAVLQAGVAREFLAGGVNSVVLACLLM